MFVHPQFDPVAFQLGPLAVRWYGLMYLVGFIQLVILGKFRARQNLLTGWHPRDVDDMLFYGVFGTILGGRLGYVLFYKPLYYFAHPAEVLAIWQGGMSFHGGFLGVLIALWLFARNRNKRWLEVTDFVAPLIPLGLAAGRLGNFINGELWGRVTSPTAPWAVYFPQAAAEDKAWITAFPQEAAARGLVAIYERVGMLPRHPSQLYESALEGLVLFALLWFYARRRRPLGAVSGLFLIGYGSFRFLVEYAREPDSFLGVLAMGLSMGQWLSLPMIVIGVLMMLWAYWRAGKAQPTIFGS
ncbi:MAG TPA: prolipoprotein diacylglyceryl transferase [Casimicrobiaceae bacterium]|jgi:phosphatidylglycerol:prolipoprotein diacylglycerol transferase|nr:prolipoprotein diacylglyceryl transferase [Casimicrobiaceae bacterium]